MMKIINRVCLFLILFFALTLPLEARVDLSLPARLDSVELTVYEAADLTYVREFRSLTLAKGINRLYFDWNAAEVDPTSVQLRVMGSEDGIIKKEVSYPAGTDSVVIWELEAKKSTAIKVESAYFMTGLDWRAIYRGRLNVAENELELLGEVEIANNSKLEFDNTKINLLMGQVNLLDELAAVISSWKKKRRRLAPPRRKSVRSDKSKMMYSAGAMMSRELEPTAKVETSQRAEYQLLRVSGRHNLRPGTREKINFVKDKLESKNIYRAGQSGPAHKVVRYLSFENKPGNDEEAVALPAGKIYLSRQTKDGEYLRLGESRMKFTSPEEKAEISLGIAEDVRVKKRIMNRERLNYSFDDENRVDGWIERVDVEIEVHNARRLPVEVEVYQRLSAPAWKILRSTHPYEKVDHNRIKTKLNLNPRQNTTVYQLIEYRHGTRRD
jgi:hypothetical protein